MYLIGFVLDSDNGDDSTVITMTTTTASSEDEWAGITQTRLAVDQSETVSVSLDLFYD